MIRSLERWRAALRLARQQLWRTKARSALTSLGILVGIAAVIAVVGLGAGAKQSIARDLSSMGSNLLMLEAGRGGGPQAHVAAPGFKAADLEAIRRQVPHLAGVSPDAQTPVTAAAGGETWQTTVSGATADWFVVGGWTVASGRTFDAGEERAGTDVCVLGETVRKNLFGDADAVGEHIRLGDVGCEVAGVLVAKGENTMGMDQDDRVVAPIRFVQRRLLGTSDVSRVMISVDSAEHIDEAALVLDEVVRDLRHVRSDDTVDFEIRDTRRMMSMMSGITTVLTAVLSGVAAVSLLVGGIGVMNVMLVSVTERTHEIGVRLAVGALEADVMAQFLAEAGLLSALGGAVGVLVGLAGTFVTAAAIGVPFVVEPWAVVGAVLTSGLIGVGFGWMPARRAARLEPIDALRSP